MSSHYRSYIENSNKRKYRCIETIGSGAYGIVYKGIREDDQKDIALKRIFLKSTDYGAPLSTLRELSALAKLSKNSDTIVSVLDTLPNKVDGRYCIDIIFELFPCDLEKFFKSYDSEYLPMSKAINITIQLTEAINFMHQHCVIHRDIKPANILIDPSTFKIKVTDFGLARILGWDACLTPEVVTLWYRSPEVLLNQEYSFSCDVWSVGCIAGEMVYGRPIFPADDMFNQLTKIVCRIGPEVLSLIDEGITMKKEVLQNEKTLDSCLRRADEIFQRIIKEMLNIYREHRITSTVALQELRAYEINFNHNNSIASNNSSFEYATIPSGSLTTSTNNTFLPKHHLVQNKQPVNSLSIPCADSHFSFNTQQFIDTQNGKDNDQHSKIVESVLRNVLEDEDEKVDDDIKGFVEQVESDDDIEGFGEQVESDDDSPVKDEEHYDDSLNGEIVPASLSNSPSSVIEDEQSEPDIDATSNTVDIPDFCDSETKGDSFSGYRSRHGTSISPITTSSHKSVDYDYSTDEQDISHKQPITKIETRTSSDTINGSNEKNHNGITKENLGSQIIPLKRSISKPLEDSSNQDNSIVSQDGSKSPFFNKSRKRELNSSNEGDLLTDSTVVLESNIIPVSDTISPIVQRVSISRNPSLRRRVSQAPNNTVSGAHDNKGVFRSETVRIYRKQSSLISHTDDSRNFKNTPNLADKSFGERSLNVALSTVQDDYQNSNVSPICQNKNVTSSHTTDNNSFITDRPRVIARRHSEIVKK